MTTHTDENPSTSHGSPDFSDAAATPSGEIKIEKIEDDEMYEEVFDKMFVSCRKNLI